MCWAIFIPKKNIYVCTTLFLKYSISMYSRIKKILPEEESQGLALCFKNVTS